MSEVGDTGEGDYSFLVQFQLILPYMDVRMTDSRVVDL